MKAIFFDIDGTLLDEKNHIPQSTREAVKRLRQNGNKAYLCSGRTRGFIINEDLLSMGFDGIVGGCGTYVEMDGKPVFNRLINPDEFAEVLAGIRKAGFRPILEGPEYLYMDDEEFGFEDPYGQRLRRELKDKMKPITGSVLEINKFSVATEDSDLIGGRQFLIDSGYDLIIHNDYVMEVIPAGFSKGTGLELVCKELGIQVSDTIAFGDSINDKSMIEAAGLGVVMGNGTDAIKQYADVITESLHEDGIYNELVRRGVI